PASVTWSSNTCPGNGIHTPTGSPTSRWTRPPTAERSADVRSQVSPARLPGQQQARSRARERRQAPTPAGTARPAHAAGPEGAEHAGLPRGRAVRALRRARIGGHWTRQCVSIVRRRPAQLRALRVVRSGRGLRMPTEDPRAHLAEG